MGFFSAVKKWWKGETEEAQSTEVTPEDGAAPEELDSPEPETEPEPESVQEVKAEPEPEPVVPDAGTTEPEPVEPQSVEQAPVILVDPEVELELEPELESESELDPEPVIVVEEAGPAESETLEAEPVVLLEVEAESGLASEPELEPEPEPEPMESTEEVPTISPRDMPSESITEQLEPWQAELTLALRQAEPRLSVWLSHVLDGVEEVDENLWTRVRFFFKALEVPTDEAENFVNDFSRWLKAMDYQYIDDFRSELQYRLALALDLEDEEDERSRLMLKLSAGLARTREHIGRRIDSLLSSHQRIDEAFWEELEEILITADVGYEPSMELVGRLRRRAQSAGTDDPEKFRDLLREELEEIFKGQRRIAAVNPPEVVLMIGVNGVGKTTTIAKLAYRARMQGKKVLIAAADTFRAAACEQLQVWAERVGAGFHTKGANADPAAVAYEAMDIAVRDGYDILFVDTAGRLHTKVNLMEELHKIRKVLGKKHAGAPHRSILVIDATTGQNALSQTKLFGEACGIDEIILTKLDGTAKGGVVVAVAMQFGIPITYIGLGEKMEDLRPFDGGNFAMALLGLDGEAK